MPYSSTSSTIKDCWIVPECEYSYPLTCYGAMKRHSDFLPAVHSTDKKWTEKYNERKKKMENGGVYIFCGNRGAGKTQMAVSIMGYFHKKLKRTVRYITAHNAIKAIKARFGSFGGDVLLNDQAKFFDTVSVLVLDAVEILKGSDFEIRELNSIIDTRYGDPLFVTIIITNDKPEMISEILGASVVDRANESGKVYVFSGDSFRCK